MANKKPSRKVVDSQVWGSSDWVVKSGRLTRPRGRPGKVAPLFSVIGEKLPYSALNLVRRDIEREGLKMTGVYMAHDSMGAPRYIGRGSIFTRLAAHLKSHPHELAYFSFYVVEEKAHEREVETLLIRGASHMLEFNERKKRVGIEPGSVYDYEPGTRFYERQKQKRNGKK